MSDLLEYRGYQGTVELSIEDQTFLGKVLHIDSLLMYEGASFSEIQAAFHETVDEYLAHCERVGIDANKPYKGSFNVRVDPETHRALAHKAAREGISLNELMKRGADAVLAPAITTHEHNHTHVHIIEPQSQTKSMASTDSPFVLYETPYIWDHEYVQ